MQDPSGRLGAGPLGDANDGTALRAHPFFDGAFLTDVTDAVGRAVEPSFKPEKAAGAPGAPGGPSEAGEAREAGNTGTTPKAVKNGSHAFLYVSGSPPLGGDVVNKLPTPNLDGADENWMMDGVATELCGGCGGASSDEEDLGGGCIRGGVLGTAATEMESKGVDDAPLQRTGSEILKP